MNIDPVALKKSEKREFIRIVIGIYLFLFLFLAVFSIRTYGDYLIMTRGKIVEVVITHIPLSNTTKYASIYFDLNGRSYSMRLNGHDGYSDNDIQEGKKIKLRHSETGTHFLFPADNPLPFDFFFLSVPFGLIILLSYKLYQHRNDEAD